jgi:hypothetical protein
MADFSFYMRLPHPLADTLYKVLSVVDGPNYSVEVNGILHRLTHEEGGLVRTPASAVVDSLSSR